MKARGKKIYIISDLTFYVKIHYSMKVLNVNNWAKHKLINCRKRLHPAEQ